MPYAVPGDISAILNAFNQLGQTNSIVHQRDLEAQAQRAAARGALGGVVGGIAGSYFGPMGAAAGSAIGSRIAGGKQVPASQTINQAGQAYQMGQAYQNQQAESSALGAASQKLGDQTPSAAQAAASTNRLNDLFAGDQTQGSVNVAANTVTPGELSQGNQDLSGVIGQAQPLSPQDQAKVAAIQQKQAILAAAQKSGNPMQTAAQALQLNQALNPLPATIKAGPGDTIYAQDKETGALTPIVNGGQGMMIDANSKPTNDPAEARYQWDVKSQKWEPINAAGQGAKTAELLNNLVWEKKNSPQTWTEKKEGLLQLLAAQQQQLVQGTGPTGLPTSLPRTDLAPFANVYAGNQQPQGQPQGTPVMMQGVPFYSGNMQPAAQAQSQPAPGQPASSTAPFALRQGEQKQQLISDSERGKYTGLLNIKNQLNQFSGMMNSGEVNPAAPQTDLLKWGVNEWKNFAQSDPGIEKWNSIQKMMTTSADAMRGTGSISDNERAMLLENIPQINDGPTRAAAKIKVWRDMTDQKIAAERGYLKSIGANPDVIDKEFNAAVKSQGHTPTQAVGGIQPVKTPAEAKALKPGTRYRTPDGRIFVR